jgi:hypothetical protein
MSVRILSKILLGFIFAITLIGINVLYAFDEQQLRSASLVTKYENGYLVSIIPQKTIIDSKGLEKYLVEPSEKKANWIYREVDKTDYPLIENKFQFSLKDNIIFFGSWHRDNLITQGERYFVKYNELGAGLHIEDVMVFVKGTEDLNKILPIWAKKYSIDDETFKWIEPQKILNIDGSNTALLEGMHRFVLSEINRMAKEKGINSSIIDISNEYNEEVYLVRLKPQSVKTYLVIVNGSSLIKNLKYSLAFIVDDGLKNRVDLIPPKILQGLEYSDYSFILEHMYHSKKLGKDLIIGKLMGNGYAVYLFFQGKDKVIKLPIFIQYGC